MTAPNALTASKQHDISRWYRNWAAFEMAQGRFFDSHMILSVSPEPLSYEALPTISELKEECSKLISSLADEQSYARYIRAYLQQSQRYLDSKYAPRSETIDPRNFFYLCDAPSSDDLTDLKKRLLASLNQCGFKGTDVISLVKGAQNKQSPIAFDVKTRIEELFTKCITPFMSQELGQTAPEYVFESGWSFETSSFRMFVRHLETKSPVIFANMTNIRPTMAFDFDSVFIHEFCGHVLHFANVRKNQDAEPLRKLIVPHTDVLFYLEGIAQAVANRMCEVYAADFPYMKLSTDYANFRLAVQADLIANIVAGNLNNSQAAAEHVANLGGAQDSVEKMYHHLSTNWMDANTTMSYYASLKHVWKVFPPDKALNRSKLNKLLDTIMTYGEFSNWIADNA